MAPHRGGAPSTRSCLRAGALLVAASGLSACWHRSGHPAVFARPPVVSESRGPTPAEPRENTREVSFQDLLQFRGKRSGGRKPFREPQTPSRVQRQLAEVRRGEDVIAIVNEAEDDELSDWMPISVATAWHRMAKYARNHQHSRSFATAKQRLMLAVESRRPDEFSPREVGNLFYAWGILKFRQNRLYDKFCADVRLRLADFDSQAVANTVKAISRVNSTQEALLTDVADMMVHRLDRFYEQEIVDTVTALAYLDFEHKPLMRAVSVYMMERLDNFKIPELAKTVYAMAKLNFRHRAFLDAFCDHVPNRFPWFNPEHLDKTIFAIGKLRHKHEYFVDQAALKVARELREYGKNSRTPSLMWSLKALQLVNGRVPADDI